VITPTFNLAPLVDKVVTVWLLTSKREITGFLTAYTEDAVEIRCDDGKGTTTVWQVRRADISAVGCNPES